MENRNDNDEKWVLPEEMNLADNVDDKEFTKNTTELQNLVTGWVDELMDDEDALAGFLFSSLAAHIEEEETAANNTNVEGAVDDDDIDSPVAQVWIGLLSDRFYQPVKDAVNRLVRPIIHGFSSEELDVLCDRFVQKVLADMLMEVNTRVMNMNVPAFLLAHMEKSQSKD